RRCAPRPATSRSPAARPAVRTAWRPRNAGPNRRRRRWPRHLPWHAGGYSSVPSGHGARRPSPTCHDVRSARRYRSQVMSPTDLLADVDLFADLTPQELLHLADASTTEDLRRGDVLFHEDDPGDTVYIVIDGRIAIAKRSIDGRESVVALMEPGDLFGEMQLFENQGRTAEARALEQSEVLAIGYGPIREVYERRP